MQIDNQKLSTFFFFFKSKVGGFEPEIFWWKHQEMSVELQGSKCHQLKVNSQIQDQIYKFITNQRIISIILRC